MENTEVKETVVEEKTKIKIGRMGCLDIFRIFSALMIILYHSIEDFSRNYGIITPFINMGSIFMTAFFILSGFCLYHTSKQIELGNPKSLGKFFLKRAISILPLYYLIIIINLIAFSSGRLKESLFLLPVELLGLQSFYPGVASTLNGGLWFVSCIIVCYLLFPLILVAIKNMKLRTRLILLGIIAAMVMYLPVPMYQFNFISLYHNPLFRFGEFSVGVILSSMLIELKQMKWQTWLFNIVTFVISFALLVTLVFVFYNNGIGLEKRMYYEVFTLPLFGLMILVLGGISCEPIDNSKIVQYIASLC